MIIANVYPGPADTQDSALKLRTILRDSASSSANIAAYGQFTWLVNDSKTYPENDNSGQWVFVPVDDLNTDSTDINYYLTAEVINRSAIRYAAYNGNTNNVMYPAYWKFNLVRYHDSPYILPRFTLHQGSHIVPGLVSVYRRVYDMNEADNVPLRLYAIDSESNPGVYPLMLNHRVIFGKRLGETYTLPESAGNYNQIEITAFQPRIEAAFYDNAARITGSTKSVSVPTSNIFTSSSIKRELMTNSALQYFSVEQDIPANLRTASTEGILSLHITFNIPASTLGSDIWDDMVRELYENDEGGNLAETFANHFHVYLQAATLAGQANTWNLTQELEASPVSSAYVNHVKVFLDDQRGRRTNDAYEGVITVSFIVMLMDGTRDGSRPSISLVSDSGSTESSYIVIRDGVSDNKWNMTFFVAPAGYYDNNNYETPSSMIEPATLDSDTLHALAQTTDIDVNDIRLLNFGNIGDPMEATQAMQDLIASEDFRIIQTMNSLVVEDEGWYVFKVNVPDECVGLSANSARMFLLSDTDADDSSLNAALVTGTGTTYFTDTSGESIDTLPEHMLAVGFLPASQRAGVYIAEKNTGNVHGDTPSSRKISAFTLSDTARENIAASLGISSSELHAITEENISSPIEAGQNLLVLLDDNYELADVLESLSVSGTGYYAFMIHVPDELAGKNINEVKLYASNSGGTLTGNFFGMDGQGLEQLQNDVIGVVRLTDGQSSGIYIGSAREVLPSAGLPVAEIEPISTLSDEVLQNIARTTSVDVEQIKFLSNDNIGTPLEATRGIADMVKEEGYELTHKMNTISVDKEGYYAFYVYVPDEYVGMSIKDVKVLLVRRSGFADAEVRTAIPVLSGLINYGEVTNILGVSIDRLEHKVLVISLLQAGESFSVYLGKLLLMILAGGCESGIGRFAFAGAVILLAGVKFMRHR